MSLVLAVTISIVMTIAIFFTRARIFIAETNMHQLGRFTEALALAQDTALARSADFAIRGLALVIALTARHEGMGFSSCD